MLRFFGATNVRIMNGGLQKWLKEGRTVYSGPYTPGEGIPFDGDYSYRPIDPSRVIMDVKRIHEIAGKIYRGSKEWQITDARPAARFNGQIADVRSNTSKSVRASHITGSINVPYSTYVDAETGCLKNDDELKKIFISKGLDLNKNMVASCGSGVTACIADLAWKICGGTSSAVYDGSWAEYVGTLIRPHLITLYRYNTKNRTFWYNMENLSLWNDPKMMLIYNRSDVSDVAQIFKPLISQICQTNTL